MKQGVKHNIKLNTSYYLTLTVVGWVDVFTRKEIRDLVLESFDYCVSHKGLNIYAYCIMTNHIHMVANANEPFHLRDVIRDFKRHTSSTIFNWINVNAESRKSWLIPLFEENARSDSKSKNIKIWKSGNHAIELYSPEFTWQKIKYIHQNPVVAGFVKEPQDWLYSSASNYMELDSVFQQVTCITPPVNIE